ncbi:hypothetical protein FB565_007795 [Actinoplanes lutulentus]|uniref:Uncharacterized protein n=1 Tax=Actinoplanes lutulentus TaxID=1287878 RepID=A0A327ZFL9_9ACTN|nr:hypothetical protein [Actinoplanes lutulentus]MBB2948024.1 hypothetical protein [Actinoplanes lutulentus]RAK40095.1 hypothetical protein B0I29_103121 [Actinoplanes lutulentus]
MERGPLTLFGAIVSVGLGPALWLGAQLGTVNVAPNERPAPVGEEQYPATDMDFGGVGAGETPDQADWIQVYPNPTATTTSPSPSPARSSSSSAAAIVVTPSSSSPSPAAPSSPSAVPSISEPSESGAPGEPSASPSPSLDEEPVPDPSEEPTGEVSEDPEPSEDAGGGAPLSSFTIN